MHPDFRMETMHARTAAAHRAADEARQAEAFKPANWFDRCEDEGD
jgi:hypothetical protein